MKIGTVTGAVWSTRKAQCLQGQTFLVVDTMLGPVVAADQVGTVSLPVLVGWKKVKYVCKHR